jgi:hypothetical protein
MQDSHHHPECAFWVLMKNSRAWKFASVDEISGAASLSAPDRALVQAMLDDVAADKAPAAGAFRPRGAPPDGVPAAAAAGAGAGAGAGAAAAADGGAAAKPPAAKRAKKEPASSAAAAPSSAAAAPSSHAAATLGGDDDEYGGGGGAAAAAAAAAAPPAAAARVKKDKGVIGDVFAAGAPVIKGGYFVFTSLRDAAAEAGIVAAGGVVEKAISKKTTAVVTEDASSASTGKIDEAIKKKIAIYSIATMRAALGI